MSEDLDYRILRRDGSSTAWQKSLLERHGLENRSGQAKGEIITRKKIARNAFFLLTNLYGVNHLEIIIKTRFRVYMTVIHLVLLYGCGETWLIRMEDIKKLFAFDHSYLRYILRNKISYFAECTKLLNE